MLILIGVSIAGCVTASDDCKGREPIYVSPATAAVMSREEKVRVVAHNEALERQCGARPVR